MSQSMKDADSRQAPRTNTLLAATASVGPTSWEVRIRNISALGARVESSVRPAAKSSITLRRGNCFAAGEVIWTNVRALGIRFFEPIDKSPWLAIPTRDALALMNEQTSGFAVIDEQPADDLDDDILIRRVAEEIGYVARVVEATAAILSEDPILRIRHCARIQELSMAVEELEGLREVIASGNKAKAIRTSVPGPVRQRLLR